mmetsp:Transcript_43777/g.108922  ORF Transcript_43777/g.108922 Transcript_43777/m.108922 type:complete len:251 (-) Transcript_43777:472-1224(-)
MTSPPFAQACDCVTCSLTLTEKYTAHSLPAARTPPGHLRREQRPRGYCVGSVIAKASASGSSWLTLGEESKAPCSCLPISACSWPMTSSACASCSCVRSSCGSAAPCALVERTSIRVAASLRSVTSVRELISSSEVRRNSSQLLPPSVPMLLMRSRLSSVTAEEEGETHEGCCAVLILETKRRARGSTLMRMSSFWSCESCSIGLSYPLACAGGMYDLTGMLWYCFMYMSSRRCSPIRFAASRMRRSASG